MQGVAFIVITGYDEVYTQSLSHRIVWLTRIIINVTSGTRQTHGQTDDGHQCLSPRDRRQNSPKCKAARTTLTPFGTEILTLYMYCTDTVFSAIFNVVKYRDLEGQESIKIIESGTIRWIGYDFLLVFYSIFVSKTHRVWNIRLIRNTDYSNFEALIGVTQGHRNVQPSRIDPPPMTSY